MRKRGSDCEVQGQEGQAGVGQAPPAAPSPSPPAGETAVPTSPSIPDASFSSPGLAPASPQERHYFPVGIFRSGQTHSAHE